MELIIRFHSFQDYSWCKLTIVFPLSRRGAVSHCVPAVPFGAEGWTPLEPLSHSPPVCGDWSSQAEDASHEELAQVCKF